MGISAAEEAAIESAFTLREYAVFRFFYSTRFCPRNAFVEGGADQVSYANQDVLPPAAASPQAHSSGSGLSATSVPRPIAVEGKQELKEEFHLFLGVTWTTALLNPRAI